MARGLIAGTVEPQWETYPLEVKLIGVGATQPAPAYSTVTNFARYCETAEGLIDVWIMVSFFTNGDQGSLTPTTTDCAYVFKLPRPANRVTGPGSPCPIPLSMHPGMAYWSFSNPWITEPIVPTLADPFTDLAGDEDSWFQCYVRRRLSFGTASLSGGNATVAAFTAGPVLVEDVDLNFTNATSLSITSGLPIITNVPGSSGFQVTCAAGTAGFAYRVLGKEPTGQFGALLNPFNPWDMTPGGLFGSFPNIFIRLTYEPRR